MNDLISGAFAEDFCKLQAEIPTMPKDKNGYGYKYTDLDTIITVLKPLLNKYGFSFIQLIKTVEGKTGIETIVLHKSGESISGFVELPVVTLGKTNNAQNEGAAITYFKRYALSAMFGISSDEDVDCSTQIMERNSKQMKAAEELKKEPPINKSSTSLSDAKPVNNTEKLLKIKVSEPASAPYTPEQGKELADLMNTQDAQGRMIFDDTAKAHYRELLFSGQFEKAKEEAKAEIKAKSLVIAVPDELFPMNDSDAPESIY